MEVIENKGANLQGKAESRMPKPEKSKEEGVEKWQGGRTDGVGERAVEDHD